ncbi:hypothetical protein O3Q52_47780 [Streptomyces sp. ActVer]|uniref:hypothetical protein n=1 Tax=Streptomyces sp. ActVer TaxID=3014558 RepID=UPI0022B44C59|nr:hypothetical protein [Streptomyces sp. ActVer]MCZ4515684.1 hypothetical protein [Streptomyces sp. ActVer]
MSEVFRTVLVPALALDLGRWFWWPGRLFHEPGPDRRQEPNKEDTHMLYHPI